MPADLLFFRLFLRVNRYFHAVVEHRILFVIVEYVELDWQACPRVLDSEVEPLCVSSRVDVVLHQTIILLVADLRSHEEVPAFKPRVKDQRTVFLAVELVTAASIPAVLDEAAVA